MKPTKKPNTKPTPEQWPQWAKNIAEASRVTGISRRTLSNYFKDGCEARKDNGKVNLDELAEWQELMGKSAGKAPAELQAARIRLLNAQSEKVERENKFRAGQTIDKSEIIQNAQKVMAILFHTLDRVFCCELPSALKGRDELAIRARCRDEIERLKELLREELARLEDEPDQEHGNSTQR